MSAASDNNGLWEDNDNMGFELSQKDVDMLTQELPADVRSMVAQKVSDRYRDGKLEVKERRVAEQIFRLLAHDTEMRVRRILSDQLKNDPHLPHDLA
ncbi:MAG: hypothetical protein IT567_02865, partial [Alphaproteobacteria bacterium]|nr:hypothetical protein [Alphaproteobacteria bacterium]